MSQANPQKIKLLAMASGGGHWVQLMRLKPVFEGADVTYASVTPVEQLDVDPAKYFYFKDVHRFNKHQLIPTVFKVFWMLLKVRPDVMITTGGLPSLITLVLARHLFRVKTIWIDSIANCEVMSTAGKHAKPHASLWLTQWPELAGEDGPQYWGAVL